jgi:tetratricopeptide (TPR) repeat protein
LTVHPAVKPGTADPRSAVVDVLLTTGDALRKTPVFWDAAFERSFRASTPPLPAKLRNAGMLRLLDDVMQSSASIQIDGDAGVWHATIDLYGRRFHLYLVLDRGMIKLIGSNEVVTAVGRYMLRAGDAAGQARSRKLLDWVRGDLDKATGTTAVTFKRLWGTGLPASPDAIQLAAAALAGASDADRVIAVATRCATTAPDGELGCHEILAEAYAAQGRGADAAAELDKIIGGRADRAAALMLRRAHALTIAGRCDDAAKLLDDRLAGDPDNHDALLGRFWTAVTCGASSEAVKRSEAIVNHAHVTPADLNNVAWYRLVAGNDLSVALELARRAVGQASTRSSLNTLAAIEAEAGELGHAIEDNAKAMALGGDPVPLLGDWYVAGRIREQLGLFDDAAAAYQRVSRDRVESALSSYTLAQKRLAAMHHR